jgi:hypothetical protein
LDRSEALSALIEDETFWRFSVRLRAVTTMASRPSLLSLAPVA